MLTTVEIASRTIRACIVRSGRVIDLIEHRIAEGADPVDALATAPLPKNLGAVRVVADLPDIMLRPLVQPQCPPERLDRLVRFELQGAQSDDQPLLDWTTVFADAEDCRVLAMLIKPGLMARLSTALKAHGATLASLVHPAAVLAAAWRDSAPRAGETALVLDVGGSRMHLAVVRDQLPLPGQQAQGLIFGRSNGPAGDELVRKVAELRSISVEQAATVLRTCKPDSASDIQEAVRASAGAIAAQALAGERFTKAQFKIDELAVDAVYVGGGGAQVPGFLEAMAARLGKPVRPLNPFAALEMGLSAERLDALAGLPSPWTLCVACAAAPSFAIDAAREVGRKKSEWWSTTGALRLGLAAAAVLCIGTIVLRYVANAGIEKNQKDLSALVGAADKKRADIDAALKQKQASRDNLAWLANERLAGRVAVELLAAFSAAQDAQERPVLLKDFRLSRLADGVRVHLTGTADSVGALSAPQVLRNMETELRRRMPEISAIEAESTAVSSEGKHPFAYRVDVRVPLSP